MKHLEYWLWGQMGLEAVLVVVVAWYLLRLRHLSQALRRLSGQVPPQAAGLAAVDERLSALETRLSRLEAAAQALEDHLQVASEAPAGWPAGPRKNPEPGSGASLRTQVEDLSRQGLRPEEIARRLGLRPAEVKVALELARLRPA
ncbi:MAG: hypothetical protein K6T55_10100 [Syntrophobacterales bacterium]|nr:hypothetical protein [Syntrophobacterales bacterium]